MVNGVCVDDQHESVSELEPGVSLGEVAEPAAPLGGGVEPVAPLRDEGSDNEPGGGEVKSSGLHYHRHCHHHLLYPPGTHPPPGH